MDQSDTNKLHLRASCRQARQRVDGADSEIRDGQVRFERLAAVVDSCRSDRVPAELGFLASRLLSRYLYLNLPYGPKLLRLSCEIADRTVRNCTRITK